MSYHLACSLILHINRDHVTPEGLKWLETTGEQDYPIAVMPVGDGVFVHVDDLANLLHPIPEGMPLSIDDVLEFAQQEGAKWVRIDRYGAQVSELPQYKHT